jgi:hypothetical protein
VCGVRRGCGSRAGNKQTTRTAFLELPPHRGPAEVRRHRDDQPAPFSRGPRSACAGPRHSRVATGLPKPPGPFLLHSVSNRAYFCRERIGHLVTAPVVANACKSVPSNTTLATSRSRLMRGSLVSGRHDCPLSSGRQGPGDPQWPAQCNGLLSAISIGLHPAQER